MDDVPANNIAPHHPALSRPSETIQSAGFLITVDYNWVITRASDNIATYIGLRPESSLGLKLDHVIPRETLHAIRNRLRLSGSAAVERLFGMRLGQTAARFDIALHLAGADIIMEFEPAATEPNNNQALLRSMIDRLHHPGGVAALCRQAVRQVRALTGFDRVMIYRFGAEDDGAVIAEAFKYGLGSQLGPRTAPAGTGAAASAEGNTLLRIIFDTEAEPVRIHPAWSAGEPLDLSMSVLRAAPPPLLAELRRAGVRCAMSIALPQSGAPWGLIICHHGRPRQLSLEARSAVELFGQMFAHILAQRQREEDAAHQARARAVHEQIAAAFSGDPGALDPLPDALLELRSYIGADGVGLHQAGQLRLAGLTPARAEALALLDWLERDGGKLFVTRSLGAQYPPAADFNMPIAGLLAIKLPRAPRSYLLFFRLAEDAGPAAGSPALRRPAPAWEPRERAAANALRQRLLEAFLHQAEAAQAANIAQLQRQEVLIAELNHRVRNMLGLVRGLINQTAAQAPDRDALARDLDERVGAMARAYGLLTDSAWDAGSLHALIRAEFEPYDPGRDRLMLAGPDVMIAPRAFATIALVLHELTTNARKHGSLSQPGGRVTVKAAPLAGGAEISWCERGGPPVPKPVRRSFGTTILERAISHELNGGSRLIFAPAGLTFEFSLPAGLARCAAPAGANRPAASARAKPDRSRLASLLTRTLLVEDNLLIALDTEDMLRQIGAAQVDVAKSVAEALEAMARQIYSFALLDINLGGETSLPVAQKLRAENVPFAFCSGYGDALALSGMPQDVALVAKPFHAASLMQALMTLLQGGQGAPSEQAS